ncbi:MAG: hypothetical protein ACPLYD_14115 [Anaerolineae bacterium]
MHLIHKRPSEKYIVWLLVSVILLVNACQASHQELETGRNSPLATPGRLISPLSPSVDITGTGLIGQLVSASERAPLSNTVVRLARVFWNEERTDGVYVLEGARSPSCMTDDNGFFVFSDIDPADYVMIVGDVYGDYVVISNPDGTPKIFTVQEGTTTDVGQVQVLLP